MAETQIQIENIKGTEAPVPTVSVDNSQNIIDFRIEQLEKQIGNKTPMVGVSVSDMNQMYSNHLITLDLMLGAIAFFILLVGGIFGWLGYRNIIEMIDNKIYKIVDARVTSATEKSLAEMKKIIEPIIEEQEKQEKQIQLEKHISKGNSNRDQKDYEGAILEYSKAIDLDPNNPELYNSRGFSRHQLNQYESAIADYDKAISLKPNVYASHNNRGASKNALKQYESAIEDLDKAILFKPERANALYHKAYAFAAMKKDPAEILKLLKKAIKNDSDFAKRAREDEVFKALMNNSEFRHLVGLDD